LAQSTHIRDDVRWTTPHAHSIISCSKILLRHGHLTCGNLRETVDHTVTLRPYKDYFVQRIVECIRRVT